MKTDRWLDRDSGFIAPKPFFIVGKDALDEPVRSNPPSERSNAVADSVLLALLIASVAFVCFPQLRALVAAWLE